VVRMLALDGKAVEVFERGSEVREETAHVGHASISERSR
jgi:hypothetical protein